MHPNADSTVVEDLHSLNNPNHCCC